MPDTPVVYCRSCQTLVAIGATTAIGSHTGPGGVEHRDLGLVHLDAEREAGETTAAYVARITALFKGAFGAPRWVEPRLITANATASASDRMIAVDTTAAAVTVTLPTPTGENRELIVTKVAGPTNKKVSFSGTGNVSTLKLQNNGESVTLMDGGPVQGWRVS